MAIFVLFYLLILFIFFFKENFFVSKKIFFYVNFFFIIIICDSIFQFFIGKNILNLNLIDNRNFRIFGDELIFRKLFFKIFFDYLITNIC